MQTFCSEMTIKYGAILKEFKIVANEENTLSKCKPAVKNIRIIMRKFG